MVEAVRRSPPSQPRGTGAATLAVAGAAVDIVFLRRLFMVNPALWIGEWVFHATLVLIILRHLRYFMNPVPAWVVWAQTPGWIAGFLLPGALLYILAIRLLTGQEKFSSPANLLMLLDVLAIAVTGLLMSTRYRADLTAVKLFALGIVTFTPVAAAARRLVPESPRARPGFAAVCPEPRLHGPAGDAGRSRSRTRTPAGAA